MDLIQQLYISLGILSIMTLFAVLIIIAGKDILFAFYRRFRSKGADVFILNSNRQFTRYYKVPKDGVFKIDNKMYITNPEKVLHLKDEMAIDVRKKLSLGRKRLEGRIGNIAKKIKATEAKLKALGNDDTVLIQKQNYMIVIEQLKGKEKILRGKLDKRNQAYYMARRGVYLYIEGDPVPKDLYEFFTEMDSVQLENVIVRAQTKDPAKTEVLEKSIKKLTWVIYATLVVAGIAAFIAFKNSSMLEGMGGVFTV